jgi:hypothetical protein
VAQEGIHSYVALHMTERKIIATYGDFSKCVDAGTICLETFMDNLRMLSESLSLAPLMLG